MGLTKKGKGSKVQVIVDGKGLSLGVIVNAASAAEWKMVQQTLDRFSEEAKLTQLIGDKAYDCDELDQTLASKK